MPMLEQRIQQQFFESADLLSHSAEALARPIAQAAHTLLGCLTAGGKLLLCGGGVSAALAQHGAALMLGRFERERPGLAALALSADASRVAGVGGGEDAQQTLAKQVHALGAPGDVLMVISASTPGAALLAAVQAARAKDMSMVALTGSDAGGLAGQLGETDVLIAVSHERTARVHELHTLAMHCLCDAIDLQLLGEQETA